MATATTPEGAHAGEPAGPAAPGVLARQGAPGQAARPGKNASVFWGDWFAVRVWALCALLMAVLLVVEFFHGLFRR